MTGTRPSERAASVRRRRAILDAARRLLHDHPASELSVAEVAAAAGVSKATAYNLVGPLDRLLTALVDDAVAEAERRFDDHPPTADVDGCLAVLAAGVDVVLGDPVANRRILGALGGLGPGDWMGVGMAGMLGRWADAATAAGTLDARRSAGTTVDLLVFGYRGVLISWVYGHVADDDLGPAVARQALHVLSDVVPDRDRPDVLDRIERLDHDLHPPRRASA